MKKGEWKRSWADITESEDHPFKIIEKMDKEEEPEEELWFGKDHTEMEAGGETNGCEAEVPGMFVLTGSSCQSEVESNRPGIKYPEGIKPIEE